MTDGSDAIADWPLLNALVNTATGATWVSIHHGGGVGIGYSQHAGMVVVADGTPEAARRLERVLTTDPGTGVIRHADAGLSGGHRLRTPHGDQGPDAAGRRFALSVPGICAALLAAAAAGPWPGLGALSLLWRVPLATAGIAFAWPRLGRRAPWLAAVAIAGLGIDAFLPSQLGQAEIAARTGSRSARLQRSLAALSADAGVLRILDPGGGEAEPEAPFPCWPPRSARCRSLSTRSC